MRTVVRWVVAVVVVLHGLIHLLGAAKGLGWADVTQRKSRSAPPWVSLGSPPPCWSCSPACY